ncbi:HD domain-containing phosphohydrolase [Roseisolibacter agri]|nr:HD domain-containing phosphohydrolase [Roseisolibacter agri]
MPQPQRVRVTARAAAASRGVSVMERADALCARGKPAAARQLLERTLHLRARRGEATAPYTMLSAVARTHLLEGDAEAALACLDAALASAEADGDASGISISLNGQAGVRLRRGELDEAERLYRRARAAGEHAGDLDSAAKAAGNLGIIASIRGDLTAALGHFDDSLSALRRLGQANTVAYALNNRGMLLRRMDRFDEAASTFDEALHTLAALGDLTGRALVHVNRAELAIARGQLDDGSTECDAAAKLARQVADDGILGEAHKLYGIIARERGELADSEEHLRTAESIADARRDLLLLAETLRERAELHHRQGRNRDMFQSLNRAHRLFAQLSARRDVADVDGRMQRLEDEFLRLARRWGDAIEAKDRFTQGHCERVAELACAIAERAGFDQRALFWFRIGALLHDVGKLIVPAEVLNKPGKLTDEEWALVRSHPSVGVEMLADTEFPWDVRPIVESHHERWDGRGYPAGLAGEAIPLTARILCVADVYDALTSVRSYKRALTHDEAMAILRQDVGTQFDPHVFAFFEEVAPAWRARVANLVPVADAPRAEPAPAGLDALTGLPGRDALVAEAARVLTARRDTTRATALLALDVDGMAALNARLGRERGDALLQRVGEILSRHTRASDVVARAGGDDFLVLLPDLEAADAERMAERLRAAVAPALGPDASLALSVGVAVLGGSSATAEALLERAERALAAAKVAGGNRLVLAV